MLKSQPGPDLNLEKSDELSAARIPYRDHHKENKVTGVN
jgi:hypothetical protein